MRRSTVLILLPQLVFPGQSHKLFFVDQMERCIFMYVGPNSVGQAVKASQGQTPQLIIEGVKQLTTYTLTRIFLKRLSRDKQTFQLISPERQCRKFLSFGVKDLYNKTFKAVINQVGGQCYKTISVRDLWNFILSQNVCQTRLERVARDKHSSLLRTFVNYGRKKFYNIGSW